MKPGLSREQVREIDRLAMAELNMPGLLLMENAGRGAAEVMAGLGVSGRVVICCGKGNNGGDGFVIARQLQILGYPVQVLLFADPRDLRGDALINYQILARAGFPVRVAGAEQIDEASLRQEFSNAAWIVDALFGTGLQGPVRAPLDRVIEWINASGARVFAVDIPSGLDCNSGEPLGSTVRAEHTATFVGLKQGFLAPASRAWTGQVHVVHIGIPTCAPFLAAPR